MAPEPLKTWLITGCSTGLGRALAQSVLEAGHRVIVTARNVEGVADLALAYPQTAHPIALDVTRRDEIERVVAMAEELGGIDVLVNNAAIAYISAIEEGEDEVVRSLFETNVLGVAAMIRAALPGMRKRRTGVIVNISSMSGRVAFAGLGYYSATKFALEGLTEALWQEVEPLGIRVLLVEPGALRTGVISRTARSEPMDAYEASAGVTRGLALANETDMAPGSPILAARAIIGAVAHSSRPHRLLLGTDALESAIARIDAQRAEFLEWDHVSRGTDFAK